jgi:hypothetical protein
MGVLGIFEIYKQVVTIPCGTIVLTIVKNKNTK